LKLNVTFMKAFFLSVWFPH